MNTQRFKEQGMINPLIVVVVVLTVLVLGLAGFGIWSFINYTDYKNNADQKIEAASSEARRLQSEEDEKKFAEREKEPTRQHVGPDDLGRVTFNYPKTWSVYVDKNGKNGVYEAYLQPLIVPPLSSETSYATRVSINDQSYERTIADYQDLVKKGSLKASPISINGENGTRFDGDFSKTVRGSMVVFKIRDKTLKVFTESTAFQNDFDNIVLKSLTFSR